MNIIYTNIPCILFSNLLKYYIIKCNTKKPFVFRVWLVCIRYFK